MIINGSFTTEHINGVPRYAAEIVKRLDQRFEKGQLELVIPQDAVIVPQLKNISIIKIGKRQSSIDHILWEYKCLSKYANQNKAGCINFSNRTEFVKNSLTTLHDIIPIAGKKYDTEWSKNLNATFTKLTKEILFYTWGYIKKRNAKYIVTVSQFSRQCISQKFHIAPERIEVIGNGWEHIRDVTSFNEERNERIQPRKYFLTLGNVFPYKNIKWIIDEARGMPYEIFVIAGKMPQDFINMFSLSLPNVIFLGYVSDAYMKYLMENCKALLFPSLIEGFGIPPLEALALNVPVIVSDIPVMREIYEEAVHYINPTGSPVDLNEILSQPLKGEREKILQEHSWERMADKWEALIRKVYF